MPVDNDIRLFFGIWLGNITQNLSDCDLMQDWSSSSDIDIPCKKVAGFFIYASMVMKFVMFMSKSCIPAEQLDQIISLLQSAAHKGRPGIGLLYTQLLEQAVDGADADDKEVHFHFRIVVGMVLSALNPLSVRALLDLLGMPTISTILCPLHLLYFVPDPDITEYPVCFFHKSFPDFLTDPG